MSQNWGCPTAAGAGGRDEPGVLWAGTIPGGLFRSADGGDSWTLNTALWERPEREKWFGGGAEQPGIHSVCVDPRDSRHVTLGVSCGGVWATRDGAETWACRANGMWAAYMPEELRGDPNIQDPHRVVQCPGAPDVLWAQHHNAAFRSTDGAAGGRRSAATYARSSASAATPGSACPRTCRPSTPSASRHSPRRRRLAEASGGVLAPLESGLAALAATGLPPLLDALVGIARRCRVDFMAGFVLGATGLSLALVALGGDPRLYLIRESLVTGGVALTFLVSLLFPKPLGYYFARYFMSGNDPARLGWGVVSPFVFWGCWGGLMLKTSASTVRGGIRGASCCRWPRSVLVDGVQGPAGAPMVRLRKYGHTPRVPKHAPGRRAP